MTWHPTHRSTIPWLPGRSPGLSHGPLPLLCEPRADCFSPLHVSVVINRARTFYHPSGEGPRWHTRDLMTSPGPCKSKTGRPYLEEPRQERELLQLARLHDAARRIEPMATSLKRGGFPRPWFREVPPRPTCPRQASQPWPATKEIDGERRRHPAASRCLKSRNNHRRVAGGLVLMPHLLLSFVHSCIHSAFLPSQ